MGVASAPAKNGASSTFLQRTYDQLSHDWALNRSPAAIKTGGGRTSFCRRPLCCRILFLGKNSGSAGLDPHGGPDRVVRRGDVVAALVELAQAACPADRRVILPLPPPRRPARPHTAEFGIAVSLKKGRQGIS